MQITIKLYAYLSKYLPPNAQRNQAPLTIPDGTTVSDVVYLLKVPPEECHLVLVDGVYIAPELRETTTLREGQALAIWPMVAGG